MVFHYLWKSGGSVTWGINLCVAFLCAADRAVDKVRVGPTTARSFLRGGETEDRWLTRNVESQNRSCDLIWRPKDDTYSTVSKRLAKTE
jgi:hypothetical protein